MQTTPSNPSLKHVVGAVSDLRTQLTSVDEQSLDHELVAVLEALKSERFLVGIIGMAKRGKSTLVNAIIGRRDDLLAPVDKYPCTTVTTTFRSGPTLSVSVALSDGANSGISPEEVRLFACEEFNPGNSKSVASIDVSGPFQSLSDGVVLVDTPGSGNALEARHADILLDFIPKSDAVIFVIAAGEPMVDAEVRLLSNISSKDIRKVIFVLTKCDMVDPDELAQGIAHNKKTIEEAGLKNPTLLCVRAKEHIQTSADPGVLALISQMRIIAIEEKSRILIERALGRTQHLVDGLLVKSRSELVLAKSNHEDLQTELNTLGTQKTELTKSRYSKELDFQRMWISAHDAFKDDVRKATKQLKSQYEVVIDGCAAAKLQSLGQTIHSDVALALAETLREPQEKYHSTLSEIESKITRTYSAGKAVLGYYQGPAAVTSKHIAKDVAAIGMSAAPAVVAAAVVTTIPGAIGTAIVSAAPAVIWYNPLTWTGAIAPIAGGAVASIGSAITTPIAVVGLGYAAYKAYMTWSMIKKKQKNELKSSVWRMLDEYTAETEGKIATAERSWSEVWNGHMSVMEERYALAIERVKAFGDPGKRESQIQKLDKTIAILEKYNQK